MVEGGFIHTVRCKIYSLIENKDKIVIVCGIFSQNMWATWLLYGTCQGLRWKKGGTYIAKDCGHLKNITLYAQKVPKWILTQVNKLVGEGNWKMVQMKILFHVFTHGHPMLEYETMYELFANLGVPNNPTMH